MKFYIARPNPLLGLIYCRRLTRSATRRTAAYHVGTRHRHIFLYKNKISKQNEEARLSYRSAAAAVF